MDTSSGGPADPHGLAATVAGWPSPQRAACEGALLIALARLLPGEHVEQVLPGRVHGHDGVVVRTDRAVIVVNGRRWAPDLRRLAHDPTLVVNGWEERGRATLSFENHEGAAAIGAIADVAGAESLAAAVRSATGATGA